MPTLEVDASIDTSYSWNAGALLAKNYGQIRITAKDMTKFWKSGPDYKQNCCYKASIQKNIQKIFGTLKFNRPKNC